MVLHELAYRRLVDFPGEELVVKLDQFPFGGRLSGSGLPAGRVEPRLVECRVRRVREDAFVEPRGGTEEGDHLIRGDRGLGDRLVGVAGGGIEAEIPRVELRVQDDLMLPASDGEQR